jgi:hypothetical protein
MLGKKHPRKKLVPPVQLTLDQFVELLTMVKDFGSQASLDIEFQGSDGSDLSTSVADDIAAKDPVIPDVILAPMVRARYSSGDSIEFRPETVPAVGQNPAYTTYMFAATGSTQVWADGVTETTMKWIDRNRSLLFRYHGRIQIGLVALFVVGVFVAALAYAGVNDRAPGPHNLYVSIPAILAAFAFLIVAINFQRYYPLFSVVVRKRSHLTTLANVSLTIGIVASVVSIIAQAVAWLTHR